MSQKEFNKLKEPLMDVNKILVEKDVDKIKKFVERRRWDMDTTKTGLWYKILEKGNGPEVNDGDDVLIDYRISLLNGKICYSSDSLGYKKFRVGQGGVESGLEEGILLLHQGDSARFIMPPHLAHGLVGDDNQIPPRAIILYELKLLEITKY